MPGLDREQILERVGRNLRDARTRAGLSQRELGELLGLDGRRAITTVSRLERGERAPSLERLCDLAFALEIDPADLLAP